MKTTIIRKFCSGVETCSFALTAALTGKAAILAAAVVTSAMLPSFADGIRWEQPKNITGDADVRTDGVTRYAYARSAVVVNGVSFTNKFHASYIPDGVETLANIVHTNMTTVSGSVTTIGSGNPAGATDAHKYLIAGGGSLMLSRADALTAGADVNIAANATLTLADGTMPVLRRLAGEGTLVFDGTVTLTNESTQAFTGTLDGDVVVRKAGYGDWTLGGTHTGTLALDAQEGTTILATDGAVVSIADGAKVSLGGASRSLGTVSGQGTITNGTLSSALVIADGSDITLGTVTLSAGVTLNGASSVTFAGTRTLRVCQSMSPPLLRRERRARRSLPWKAKWPASRHSRSAGADTRQSFPPMARDTLSVARALRLS